MTPPTHSSLAVFAHELREPLSSILLAVQAASEAATDDLTSLELWGVVERQSRHLARMVDRVMDGTRESRLDPTLSKEWFDLGATILCAAEAVKSKVLERRHRLTVSLPPDPVCVLADALRIQQVIINLLANSAKYTAWGGQITVSLEAANGLVTIKVRDNGVGISPEQLPRVFDLFHRVDGSEGDKQPGLGVGLAVIKSLVELHGGNVSAHSGGLGTGSTFVVLLPQVAPGARKWQTNAQEARGRSPVEASWMHTAMLDA